MIMPGASMSLKGPIMTAADDKFVPSFLIFGKKGMIFDENRLPANVSDQIICLICYFFKSSKI